MNQWISDSNEMNLFNFDENTFMRSPLFLFPPPFLIFFILLITRNSLKTLQRMPLEPDYIFLLVYVRLFPIWLSKREYILVQ